MVLEHFLGVVLFVAAGADQPGAEPSGVQPVVPSSRSSRQRTTLVGLVHDRLTGKTNDSESHGLVEPSSWAASPDPRPFRAENPELAGSGPVLPAVAETEQLATPTPQYPTQPTRLASPRRRRVPERTVADYVKEAWAARKARPSPFARLGSLWGDFDEDESADSTEPADWSDGPPSLESPTGESVWESPRPETRRPLPMGLWPKSPSGSSPPQASESAGRKSSPLRLMTPPSDRQAGSIAPADSHPAVPANAKVAQANRLEVKSEKQTSRPLPRNTLKPVGDPVATASASSDRHHSAAPAVPVGSVPSSLASDRHGQAPVASVEPDLTGPALFPPPVVAAMNAAPADHLDKHALPEPAANESVAASEVAAAPSVREPATVLDTAAPASVEVAAGALSSKPSSNELTPAAFVERTSPDPEDVVRVPEETSVVVERNDTSAAVPAESEATAELPGSESDNESATAEEPTRDGTKSAARPQGFVLFDRLKNLPFEYYAGGLLVLTAVVFLLLPSRRPAETVRTDSGMLGAFVMAVGLAIVAVGVAAVVRAQMALQPSLFRPGMLIAAAGQVVLLIGIIALAARHTRGMRMRRMSEGPAIQSELAQLGYALVPAGPVSPAVPPIASAAGSAARTSNPVHSGQIAQLKAQLVCLSQQLDHLVSGA